MKLLALLTGLLAGIVLGVVGSVHAATILYPTGGGTGWQNIQTGALLYGNGTNRLSTTTQGTNGQALAWLGGIPTWTSTSTFGLPFAWTPTSYGNSTSTTLGFLNGFLSTASSTFNASTNFPSGIWNSSGNVGIGTTTPWGKLSVTNTSASPSFIVEDSTSPDTTPFIIDASGNVGIGTSTAASIFTVRGTTGNAGNAATFGMSSDVDNGVVIGRNSTVNPQELWLGVNQTNGYSVIQAAQSGVGFNKPLLLNPTNGNVGIGTTTPGSKLSVSGGVSIGANYGVAAPTNGLIVEGNVGIGTTSPYAPLSVVGAGGVVAGKFTATSTGNSLADLTVTNLSSGLVGNNSGLLYSFASSSLFGYTPLNPTRQLTINGTASQITSSAGAQTLEADRTWTLSLPNHVIFPSSYQATNATTTNATTTGSHYFPGSGVWKLSGNVGIGTTSPASLLTVRGTTGNAGNAATFGLSADTDSGVVIARTATVNPQELWLGVNQTIGYASIQAAQSGVGFNESLVLNPTNGNVGIGTTTPGFKLSVQFASDGNMFQLYDTDGNCLQNPESGGITTTCTSDEKYKEDIRDTTGSALDYFANFRLRDYEVKASGETTTGVVAQELELTHPELVHDIVATSTYQVQTGTEIVKDDEGNDVEQPVYETRETTSTSKFVTLPSIWQVVKAIQEMHTKLTNVFRFNGDTATGMTLYDDKGGAHCITVSSLNVLTSVNGACK